MNDCSDEAPAQESREQLEEGEICQAQDDVVKAIA